MPQNPISHLSVEDSARFVTIAEANLACDANGYRTDEEKSSLITTLAGMAHAASTCGGRQQGNVAAKPTLFDKLHCTVSLTPLLKYCPAHTSR